ncbi:MAG: TonB family protein [Candidatus Aminicenantales bacterium]
MKDKKILVVDFDEESLISLSNLVFEEGFQAVTAMDGLSGYEKYKTEAFDLVMIEPMLPKLHGFELMKRINQDPTRKTPIIVVTGIYREPSCKREALQVYGASGYFTKPWNKDDLRAKMLELLANGKEEPIEKQEAPASSPARSPSAPPADDWGLLKRETAPREPKAAKGLDDLEKELQAAVSGLTGTSRKKEPIKDAGKEKKETKSAVDGDIEALLKGAIGGLGLDEKKKKVEPAAKPIPSFEPKSIMDTVEKKEKIPVAKEIIERIPPQHRMKDHVPPAPARVHFDIEKTIRGIDQTLIEIDKIPLDMEKGFPGPARAPVETEKAEPVDKKAYFDEYAEPVRKKPPVALVGGLAAAFLIVAGSTFMVLKSKKPKEPERQMVSSLQPSLPSEFAQKHEEIPAVSAKRESVSEPAPKTESKPAPKKESSSPAEQPAASESMVPIQPIIPKVTPSLGLELQKEPATESSSPASQETVPQTKTPIQQEAFPPTEPPPAKPQANEPTRVMAKPGDLFPLDSVDVAPVLLKKINPKYPGQALNMGVGGTVTVNALISETGDVIRTEILKGIKGGLGLERAAETAIRQWQFKPAEKDGVPVRVWKPLDIVFKTNPSPNQ